MRRAALLVALLAWAPPLASAETAQVFTVTFVNETPLELQVVAYEKSSDSSLQQKLPAGKTRKLVLGELACKSKRELRFSVFETAGGRHLVQGTMRLETGGPAREGCSASRIDFDRCAADSGVGVEVACRDGASDRGRVTLALD